MGVQPGGAAKKALATLLGVLVAAGALAALTPASARAVTPTPAAALSKPALALSTSRALPYARVLVAGRRFPSRKRSAVFLGRTRLRTFRMRGNGSFRLYVRLPRQRAAGLYTLSARSGKRVARKRFRILAPKPAPPPAGKPAAQPAAGPPPEATRLVAAGDIACVPGFTMTATTCRHERVADRVAALRPDAVATLGDAQYEHGLLSEYMGSYDTSWGRFKGITRPATGNHEYGASEDKRTAPGHFGYFGAAAGDPNEGYYTYALGDWQAIALNSGDIQWTRRSDNTLPDDCYPMSCRAGSDQERWLRQVLSSLPPQKCVVAYWHHPLWSSVRQWEYSEVAALYQALYDHGAELALAGHSHAYERFAPMRPDGTVELSGGVREFVVGTGGRDRRFADPTPASTRPGSEKQVLNAEGFGVLELSLFPGRYEFRFVGEDGVVRDSGAGDCHGAPASAG